MDLRSYIPALPEVKDPKAGDLRVWWIPDVPGTGLRVPVRSLTEARFALALLADYDMFLLRNKMRPDTGAHGWGVEVYDPASKDTDDEDVPPALRCIGWIEFETADGEGFDDLDDAARAALDARRAKGEQVHA
jgi:hypothetical protein